MEPYCWGCDPTIGTCVLNCQQLINTLYSDCDGVCLPDGYYFDPSLFFLFTNFVYFTPFHSLLFHLEFQLSGCWDDVSVQILVSVERCGCNSAIPKYVTTVIPLWMLLILIITYLLY